MTLPNGKDCYKGPRENLKLSRALCGAWSYNFYGLKPSGVIQSHTCTLRDNAVNKPFSSFVVPLFQNESVQNLSYEDESDLHENKPVGGAHYHINGFVLT